MHNLIDVEYILDSVIRQKNFRSKGHRQGSAVGWNKKEFIAWDGEGITHDEPVDAGLGRYHKLGERDVWIDFKYRATPQNYVLLDNSKGSHITNKDGLPTVRCLDFLLDTKAQYPQSIFVGFGFNYDVNQILKDLPEHCLWQLHDNNKSWFNGYRIKWIPRKFFQVSHRKTKRSMILYDVFSYFQSSFLSVCKDYLGEDDPQLDIIQKGKEARELFEWEELDEFILPYCDTELAMLVRIMNILRQNFHDVGINPGRWHGPGAVANVVLRQHKITVSRDIPSEVLDASQFAYAGGRFESFALGRHSDTVWEYDINSAYPEAITQLPDLSNGRWEYVDRYEPDSFGVWSINYRANDGPWYEADRPQPLFCRSRGGSISYPCKVQGWYWTPEANLVPDSVKGGWIFRANEDTRPFAFVKEMYEQRRLLKQQGNSTERALKLILNSLYGKLAQTIGGIDKPPPWHQLEWAGFITSYTRAKIYEATQLNPSAIIAAETDAVFSTEPLDLPESEELGDWKMKLYKEIVYIQSGYYYAIKPSGEIICKYRGMDKDKETQQPLGLPYEKVVKHLDEWTARLPGHRSLGLESHTTRFIGLGLGLRTNSVWRSWEKRDRNISIDMKPNKWVLAQKRNHISAECPLCLSGISMAKCLHPTVIGGHAGRSYARSIPWRSIHEDTDIDWEEWCEMNPEMKEWGDDMDKWQ
jgi:hypothetical protein